MKIKTSELSSVALDWAVASCESLFFRRLEIENYHNGYSPSTNWAQGGPIIEREAIELSPQNFGEFWVALYPQWQTSHRQEGQTPLIAAMLCYVTSKLGEYVDIPEELLK